VGDNQDTDIKGATAAGIESIWIDWYGTPSGNRYGAIAVARGFKELRDVLHKVLGARNQDRKLV